MFAVPAEGVEEEIKLCGGGGMQPALGSGLVLSRDSPKPYVNVSLIKGEGKQIRFQAAARCCLVFRGCSAPAAVTAAPLAQFPKGWCWKGGGADYELTVRGLEARFLERRKLSAISAAAVSAAFSTRASGQLPPRPRASRKWGPDANAAEGWRREWG